MCVFSRHDETAFTHFQYDILVNVQGPTDLSNQYFFHVTDFPKLWDNYFAIQLSE